MKYITTPRIFALLSFILVSCDGEKQAADITTIPFSDAVAQTKDIPLSRIAESVEYILLETTDRSLISNIWNNGVSVTPEYFFIHASEGLLQFDSRGKFLRQIGSQGSGPGQYATAFGNIAVNDRLRRIYMPAYMQHKAIVYDYDGNYLGDMPMPDVDNPTLLNDSVFAGSAGNGSIALLNTNGDVIRRFPYKDEQTEKLGDAFLGMVGFTSTLYRFDGNLFYKYGYGDTIYQIEQTAMLPRHIIETGRYALPADLRFEAMNGDAERFAKETSSYMRMGVLEFSRYILLPYTGWGNLFGAEPFRLAVYDKQTGDCYSVRGDTLRNDIDGGLPFYPAIPVDDNSVLMIWQASEAVERLAQSERPAQLRNLDADDNPVLMIVRLKAD
jgi:hypothetical protein